MFPDAEMQGLKKSDKTQLYSKSIGDSGPELRNAVKRPHGTMVEDARAYF